MRTGGRVAASAVQKGIFMKKRFYFTDLLMWFLLGVCVVLVALLALLKPALLIPAGILAFVLALLTAMNVRNLRKVMRRMMHGRGYTDSNTQHSLEQLRLPVLVLSGDTVLWYNEAFSKEVLAGDDICFAPVETLLPGFDRRQVSDAHGQNLTVDTTRYTVYGGGTPGGKEIFVAYFVENTQLKQQAEEYVATRPSVMMIEVDTYDELLRELRESERVRIMGELELALEQFIGSTTGFLRRISASRYIGVVEERHMEQLVQSRFSLLDTVRAIGGSEDLVTLSIGVGRKGDTLQMSAEMAAQALDMALGRGGDQAAIKSADGYEFFGGVSRSVERQNRVRSRIIASALREVVRQSSNVLIMGHKMSDLDCVGAAAGVWRICRICDKPAAIVVDERASLAANLIEELRADGCDFVRPDGAENSVGRHTLVVIVDTHRAALLENRNIYKEANNVVVIDHHRRCVDYIDNAMIFYHEPSASSASELVAELLQYIESPCKEKKLTGVGAQALLAGIMLDTRNFAIHTGVRTFEAAAYLRRMGARTTEVKRLFNSTLESYAYKAQLVTEAEIFMGCAIVVTDTLPSELNVVVPQAANDLLTIEGVEASFVAVESYGKVSISARSMGDVNVQVIMEKLGGGGHLTMAGAQMKDVTLEQTRDRLLQLIEEYRENCVSEKASKGAK